MPTKDGEETPGKSSQISDNNINRWVNVKLNLNKIPGHQKHNLLMTLVRKKNNNN